MKFDINNYKGNYVMHCKTEEEAKEFCDYLHSIGKTWGDGDSYKKIISWSSTREGGTCYNFNDGWVGSKRSYIDKGYTILEWSDFTTEFTKADLKDGMVVEYRNGDRRLVLGECFVGHNNCSHFNVWYDDNLINNNNASCRDVCKVYKSSPELMNQCFDDKYLTLIWERKEKPEPEEMTLAEVCKALGKEIKIVKG